MKRKVKMENNDLIFKHTSLEITDDVENCLMWKMEDIKGKKLPIDTGLADYIAFANDNLESQLSQLKAVKQEISQREKALKGQIDNIKVNGATFLLENGLDRLDGLICSSVTVSKAREPKTTIEKVKMFVMNISKDELEELLIGLGKGEHVEEEIEKTSNAIPAKLKINKRKIALAEVE